MRKIEILLSLTSDQSHNVENYTIFQVRNFQKYLLDQLFNSYFNLSSFLTGQLKSICMGRGGANCIQH